MCSDKPLVDERFRTIGTTIAPRYRGISPISPPARTSSKFLSATDRYPGGSFYSSIICIQPISNARVRLDANTLKRPEISELKHKVLSSELGKLDGGLGFFAAPGYFEHAPLAERLVYDAHPFPHTHLGFLDL